MNLSIKSWNYHLLTSPMIRFISKLCLKHEANSSRYSDKVLLLCCFQTSMINCPHIFLCLFQVAARVDMQSAQQHAGQGERHPAPSHPALQLLWPGWPGRRLAGAGQPRVQTDGWAQTDSLPNVINNSQKTFWHWAGKIFTGHNQIEINRKHYHNFSFSCSESKYILFTMTNLHIFQAMFCVFPKWMTLNFCQLTNRLTE